MQLIKSHSHLSNIIAKHGKATPLNKDNPHDLMERIVKTIDSEEAFGDEHFWKLIHNNVLQGDAILVSHTAPEGFTDKIGVIGDNLEPIR